MKYAATAAATAAAAPTAVGSAQSTAVGDIADRYDRVVDVVEAGADPTGGSPATDVIEQALDDNTLLVFPEGRYRVGKISVSHSNYGLISADGATPVLEPATSASGFDGRAYLFVLRGRDIFMEGFQLDYTADGYGGRIQAIAGAGSLTVRDLTIEGSNDGGSGTFRFDVRESGAPGLIENVAAPDGGDTVGMFVGLEHAGKLTIRNCHMEGFADNGLYGSPPSRRDRSGAGGGTVHVEGGLFKNNNVAQVRVGGQSSVSDVDIVVDTDDIKDKGGAVNARGIRVDEAGGAVIDGCSITLDAPVSCLGGVVLSGTAGAATVRNTDISLNNPDADAGIHARNPGSVERTGSTIENVTIVGSVANVPGVLVQDRSGADVDNCCLSLDGSDQNGLVFDGSDGTVTDTNIDVTGQALVFRDADGTTRNITYDESCALSGSSTGSTDDSTGDSTDDSDSTDEYADLRFADSRAESGDALVYSVAVDGELVAADINNNDTLDGSTASGQVNGGDDSYRFTGSITDLTVDEGVAVTVDGESIDPAKFGDQSDDDTDASDDSGSTDEYADLRFADPRAELGDPLAYAVSVDGELVAADINNNDTLDGSTASGQVNGGDDSYRFTGSITDLTVDEGVAVTVDGESVEPDTVRELPNLVVFDGSNDDAVTSYQLEVTGRIERDETRTERVDDSWDTLESTVTDTEAIGIVHTGVDAYRFSGEVADLDIRGSATVAFEGVTYEVTE